MSGEVVFGNVSVTVNAYDNVGVVKTELYVGGVLTATSTSAPFTMRWNIAEDFRRDQDAGGQGL